MDQHYNEQHTTLYKKINVLSFSVHVKDNIAYTTYYKYHYKS